MVVLLAAWLHAWVHVPYTLLFKVCRAQLSGQAAPQVRVSEALGLDPFHLLSDPGTRVYLHVSTSTCG